MIDEEHYVDCDRCGERYHGEFIAAYLREVEVPGGVDMVCLRCIENENKAKKEKKWTRSSWSSCTRK